MGRLAGTPLISLHNPVTTRLIQAWYVISVLRIFLQTVKVVVIEEWKVSL